MHAGRAYRADLPHIDALVKTIRAVEASVGQPWGAGLLVSMGDIGRSFTVSHPSGPANVAPEPGPYTPAERDEERMVMSFENFQVAAEHDGSAGAMSHRPPWHTSCPASTHSRFSGSVYADTARLMMLYDGVL